MFCPKCGQQQIPEATRFCSRCGLAISGMTEWIARWDDPGMPKRSARARLASAKKETKRGAKLMFVAGVLAPVFFGLSIVVDSPGPLLVPLCLFLLGGAVMLYAELFGEETPDFKSHQAQPSQLGTAPGAALPPASSVGINNIGGQRINTAEIVQPPSVTDRTTKLLDLETPKNE